MLSLYEANQRQHQLPASENYRHPWTRFEPNVDSEVDDDENWLDTPVFPYASGYDKEAGPKYYYENEINGPHMELEDKERWRGYGVDPRNKRFMVRRK